jgi:uncharacterized protein (TIGR02001 family)
MKFISVYILILSLSATSFAQDKSKSAIATYAISGEAQLLSQYMVKGLAYSDGNPAMNASFLASFGSQVKLGVWGSNISNLSAVDDNFWFKFVGNIKIELTDKLLADLYVYDNHFYKSNQRNGLVAGTHFTYNFYEFVFEWIGNFEGTKTSAEYFNFGKLFNYKQNFKLGGYAGFTNSHSDSLNSYLDVRAVAQYIFNSASNAEIGLTYNTNGTQFGKRGDTAFYLGVKLAY